MTQRKLVEPKATTKIAKSGHKNIAQSLGEYKQFMLMALGGSRNFVTHPDQQEYAIPNTPANRRVIKLMPKPHIRIIYVPIEDNAGMECRIHLTQAARDLFLDISPDMLEKMVELDAIAPDVWDYTPPATIIANREMVSVFGEEFARMDKLAREVEAEEVIRKAKQDEDQNDPAES